MANFKKRNSRPYLALYTTGCKALALTHRNFDDFVVVREIAGVDRLLEMVAVAVGLKQIRYSFRAVVVAELAERSLPTPEICSSNPNIEKIYLSLV